MNSYAELLKQGMQLFKKGHIQAARDAYSSVLVKIPNQPDALNLLGALESSQDNTEVALRLLRRAIEIKPQHTSALTNLGKALQKIGDYESATACLERVANMKPQSAEAQTNLGVSFFDGGNLAQAQSCFEQAISLDAAFAPAHHYLGKLFMHKQDWQRAAAYCKQAFVAQTSRIEAKIDEGQCWIELYDFSLAAACFKWAIRLDNENPIAHLGLGRAQFYLGQFERALVSFELARSYNDELPTLDQYLGKTLCNLGQIEAAEAAFWRGLSRDPEDLGLHVHLAELYRKSHRRNESAEIVTQGLALDGDNIELRLTRAKLLREQGQSHEAIIQLTNLLQHPLSSHDLETVHFELGQLHHQNSSYSEAFAHFTTANGISLHREQSQGTRNESLLERTTEIKSQTRQDWIGGIQDTGRRSAGYTENELVFVVGFPRSGCTLLEAILTPHPDIQTLPRIDTLAPIIRHLINKPGGLMRGLASLDELETKSLQDKYFEEVDKHLPTRYDRALINVNPVNSIYAAAIHRVFPNARFVFCLRHPYDVVLSCFFHQFPRNDSSMSFNSLEQITDLYIKMLELWGKTCELLRIPAREQKYEDLIENPEMEMQGLLNYLNLPWDDRVLHFDAHMRRHGRFAIPGYRQVSQPLYSESKDRWHHYVDHLEPIRDRLDPFVRGLGY